jgi:hypothetical protein
MQGDFLDEKYARDVTREERGEKKMRDRKLLLDYFFNSPAKNIMYTFRVYNGENDRN